MNGSLGTAPKIGFSLTVFALLVSAALSIRGQQIVYSNDGWVDHTSRVVATLQTILTTVFDAESNQRGYIITGNESYLEPYQSASSQYKNIIRELAELVSDNPEEMSNADQLGALASQRFETLQRGIDRRRNDGLEGGREHVVTGEGKQQMDDVREMVSRMQKTERKLLVQRAAQSDASHRAALFTVGIMTLLGLGMVGTAYTLAAREAETRRRATDLLEQRVKERTNELAELNESLQLSNRDLEQFASVASHDLQEPLRKIEAFGDRLMTRSYDGLDEQGRDYLERLLASASRMRRLITDLLNFSRITTRAQTPVAVDMNIVARDVLSDLESRVQQAGGKVEIGELPVIDADPTQIRQLLQNLIGNSLKFHREGVPPIVTVSAKSIDGGPKGEMCELTVSDNGVGFDNTYRDRIFDIFQRLHGRNEFEGTGIGLAICRKITDRHSGTITASGNLGQGSTFVVTLPIKQTQEELKHGWTT